jgi:hypothetical protein
MKGSKPPADELGQITVRLRKELRDQLIAAANERVIGVDFLVTKALEAYLPRLVPIRELVDYDTHAAMQDQGPKE